VYSFVPDSSRAAVFDSTMELELAPPAATRRGAFLLRIGCRLFASCRELGQLFRVLCVAVSAHLLGPKISPTPATSPPAPPNRGGAFPRGLFLLRRRTLAWRIGAAPPMTGGLCPTTLSFVRSKMLLASTSVDDTTGRGPVHRLPNRSIYHGANVIS
jgi:hypothetical protein